MTSPWDWSDEILVILASSVRKNLFPLFVAGNKADLAPEGVIEHLSQVIPQFIPCSAETEFALRKADEAGFIEYTSGDSTFSIPDKSVLNEAQAKGLEMLQQRLTKMEGTGPVSYTHLTLPTKRIV